VAQALAETDEDVPRVQHEAIIRTFLFTDLRNCRGVGVYCRGSMAGRLSYIGEIGHLYSGTLQARDCLEMLRIGSEPNNKHRYCTGTLHVLDTCSETVRAIDSPRTLTVGDGRPLRLVPEQNGVDSGLILSLSFHCIALSWR
jgi:hypothetical protein